MVLNEILRELACVFDDLFADTVLNEGLLEQCVTAVFLVGQNALNTRRGTLCLSRDSRAALFFKGRFDGTKGIARQVPLVDETDGLRLLRNDHGLPIRPALISQQPFVMQLHMTGAHSLPDPPGDAGTGVLAFGLSKCTVDRNEKFTLRMDGVDVLLLKDDRNSQVPQLPREVERIHSVPGKS